MKTFLVKLAVVLTFALMGVLTVSGPVVAQEPGEEVEEIIIRAPMSVERREVGNASSSIMARTEIVELKRLVSFADLDLSKDEDVALLENRIAVVAKDSCEKLSDMFPLDRSDYLEMRNCTRQAIESALGDKEQAIAATQ